jgi:sulfatase maturation enzyme AslB (radical SAM superfamily)
MAEAWPLTSLTLVLTAACNLRCTYCYQTLKREGRMSWNTARTAVDCLLGSAGPSPGLALTGGEPLLAYSTLRRVVERVRAAGPIGRATRITLLTNGTRLGDAQARFLAANRVSVRISIDGGPAAQRSRGAWTARWLDQLLDDLRHRHRYWFTRRVSVSATVTPENVPFLADSIEYLLRKGVRAIEVAPAIGPAPGWDHRLRTVLNAQVARIFETSLEIYRRSGRVPLRLFQHGTRYRGSQPMCGIAEGTRLVVNTDGNVYGCTAGVTSFLRNPSPLLERTSEAMHLGHIADPELACRLPAYAEALRATGLFGPRNRLHSSYRACARCRHLGRCVVCPLATAHTPGATDPTRVPDFACAFNQVALRYQARFPRPDVASPAAGPHSTLLSQYARGRHEQTKRRLLS